eukprot:2702909-Rhodomonas_salina.1
MKTVRRRGTTSTRALECITRITTCDRCCHKLRRRLPLHSHFSAHQASKTQKSTLADQASSDGRSVSSDQYHFCQLVPLLALGHALAVQVAHGLVLGRVRVGAA